jgi:hypothetical protein
MTSETKYYIVGVVPVKLVPTADGGLAVLQLSWDTGELEHNMELYQHVRYARNDVKAVTADDFIQHVEAIRARRLSGEGTVFALYKLMNGIEDVAKEEGRELRPDEEELLAELRRQSHALFQAEHPDPV